ncbi:MAG: hypothetical protein ACRCX2_24200 [Paraclostridium sp.]
MEIKIKYFVTKDACRFFFFNNRNLYRISIRISKSRRTKKTIYTIEPSIAKYKQNFQSLILNKPILKKGKFSVTSIDIFYHRLKDSEVLDLKTIDEKKVYESFIKVINSKVFPDYLCYENLTLQRFFKEKAIELTKEWVS